MFIEIDELTTAIYDYTLGGITTDEVVKHTAILAAISEISSHLNGKYDTAAIFNATGDDRDILIVEHCKSIAVWYILRLSNADIIFDKAKIYYDNAIDWLKMVSGMRTHGKSINPNLPLKQENGETISRIRGGSNKKFTHSF